MDDLDTRAREAAHAAVDRHVTALYQAHALSLARLALLMLGDRDLILRGGENIYPIEIENRVVEHPDIDEAAVIGVDHPELGQEIKAFVVPRPGSPLTAEQVRLWCAAALAAYKVPARVEFRASLPYNQTGKLMKQELECEERARASAERPSG